jgi:regulator of protease activity HflC (stomatin/prohibitin superfamily)
MKKTIATAIALSLLAMTGCTRIDTGEVGLRVNFDKTIEASERAAGSFNQTFIGSVITFPVREIAVDVKDLTPLAADNSTMADFDLTIVYNINPSTVSDLYINKSRSFHSMNDHGETLLMHSYLQMVAKNAVFKVARQFKALEMNDRRAEIEAGILTQMKASLDTEKLGDSVLITQVQVKSIAPSAAVKKAADDLVRAQAELAAKTIEVQTATKEAERIAALNSNAGAISYMNAQAQMKIAEGIAAGKVNTIVVPYDFKGMVQVAK